MSPPPVTVIVGDENLLISRAISEVVDAARSVDPDVVVNDCRGTPFGAEQVFSLTSPSLFGGWQVWILQADASLDPEVAAALRTYAAEPVEQTVLVVVAPDKRASSLAAALVSLGAEERRAAKPTRLRERWDFVATEARRAGVRLSEDAVRTLADAVGSDLGELAGAVQRVAQSASRGSLLTEQDVLQHFRGRAETSGFTVADAVVSGDGERALVLLRQALTHGVAPVLILSAVASGIRDVARVASAADRASSAAEKRELGRQLGMPDWKVERVTRAARSWSSHGLSAAFGCIAQADRELKGAGTSPGFALERLVLSVSSQARGRRSGLDRSSR